MGQVKGGLMEAESVALMAATLIAIVSIVVVAVIVNLVGKHEETEDDYWRKQW